MPNPTPKKPSGNKTLVSTTEDLREKLQQALSVLDSIASDEPSSPRQRPSNLTESDVRVILRARRRRSRFFPEGLFADPAWDMLLELYAAELGQRRTTISSLCIGAAVPASTALRWIGTLEKENLVIRHQDPLDGRRVFVSLADEGLSAMESYFADLLGPASAGI